MKKPVRIAILTLVALVWSIQVFAQSPQTVTNGDHTTAVSFSPGCTYSWLNSDPSIGLPASGTGNIASFTAVNTGSVPITATITATPSTAFAYIANYSGNVSVISTLTHSVVGTIPAGDRPWGIAASKDGTRVYVSNYGSNNVSVIRTFDNSVIATIPVGSTPEGIAVSPNGSRVYVANTGPSNVAALGPNTVSVINTVTNSVIAEVGVGLNPVGVAVSPDGKKIFVTNQLANTVSVIDAATNTVSATVTAGSSTWGITVSPDGSLVYIANPGTNTVSAISTITNTVVGSVNVYGSPAGIAINADGTRLYVTSAANSTLTVINTADNSILTTIPMDSSPCGVSISNDGKEVYVADYNSTNIAVISTATNTRTNSIPTGDVAFSMGSFMSTGPACNGSPLTFTITVNPTPPATSLAVSGVLQPLQTVYGTPSSSETFTVSGQNIADAILITPPAGFEVSTNNIDFSSTASITGTGNISAPVYIRLAAATPVESYSGPIILSTSNTGSLNVTVPVSIVSPAPLTITADNKSRYYSTTNPALTLTYQGFVNQEGPAQLASQPIATTSATLTSAVGQYPIIPNGAASTNYSFNYIRGVLTIEPALKELTIPNTFTPNSDGVNDTWSIDGLNSYPGCTVNIFSRWGQKLFSSTGYPIPWDGKYNGVPLASGTYYYIVDPKNGKSVVAGWVAIIR